MEYTFEIYEDAENQLRFCYKNPKGEILFVGESCASREECMRMIDEIKDSAPTAPIAEI